MAQVTKVPTITSQYSLQTIEIIKYLTILCYMFNDLHLCYIFNDLHEGMGANQLCRIVFGISSQIVRDGHRDMGDVSTYGKIIRNLLGSMKPPGSNFCVDTQRYKYLRIFQRVNTDRDQH